MKSIAFFIVLISIVYADNVNNGQMTDLPGVDIPVTCSDKTLGSNYYKAYSLDLDQYYYYNDPFATAFSLDYCRTLALEPGQYRCCYAHAKFTYNNTSGTGRFCVPITYSEYYDKDLQPDESDERFLKLIGISISDYKINCNSKYLSVAASFIALLAALF